MRESEAIWKLARAELVVPAEGGASDVFLWEHSVRVAKSAQVLARLPEARTHNPDSLALLAAALFHEAGWISRWRSGEIERHEIMMGSPSESIVVESVRLMRHALKDVIPDHSLTRAGETIRFRVTHAPDPIEASILTEADNLEEFGLGFLWMAIRRGICGGRGVQAVLDAWNRRIEYQFWNARLKDAFRFEASRRLAESRLRHLELLMAEMAVQHEVEDVRSLVESVSGCPFDHPPWPAGIQNRPKSKS